MLKKTIKLHPKQTTMAVGIATVLLFYLSWCFSTIAYRGITFVLLCALGMSLAAVFYCGCIWMSVQNWENKRVVNQLKKLNFIILFFFVFAAVLSGRWLVQEGRLPVLVSEFIWIMAAVFCYMQLRKIQFSICDRDKISVCNFLKNHYILTVVLLTVAFLSFERTGSQFKWDGGLYYQAADRMNIYSLSSLGAFGHLSQGYGFLIGFFQLFFRDTGKTLFFLNVVLLEVSICAFYSVLKMLAPGHKNTLYEAAAAVYAFSPFLLGMVNYYSPDYYSLLLFTVVIYFTCKRQWILQFVFSLFYCFTKEPAIVTYGSLCVGLVLQDYFLKKGDNYEKIGERFRRIVSSEQYYLMLLIGFLWIITYLMLGGWSGGAGKFSLSGAYVYSKLKVLYFLNFNWIFLIIIAICIFLALYKKKVREWLGKLFPLGCSLIGFTIFSIAFQTSNHPRYAAAAPAALYLLAIVLLFSISGDQIGRWLMAGVAILLLISCYRTIDPISFLCFKKVNVGERYMITTASKMPGDGMIYNKQMLWMEIPINQAIEYALSKKAEVVFPAEEGNSYHFDGFPLNKEKYGQAEFFREYWDEIRKVRMPVSSQNSKELQVYQVSEKLNFPEKTDEMPVCYIYAPIAGESMAKSIEQQYTILEKRQFLYRGWLIEAMLFKR